MSINPLELFAEQPAIASHSIQADQGLTIHHRHDLPGELDASTGFSHHMLTFFLSKNERQTTHLDDCGKYDGQMNAGDFYLYPAGVSGFTRWQSADETIHVVIEPSFLNRVAIDTECKNSGTFELLPTLKSNDRTFNNLVQLFLAELSDRDFGDKLYLESLSSLLGIHLLRHYCNSNPSVSQHSSGLAPRQLRAAIDYIQGHLDGDLSLEAIAAQTNMGRCYFAAKFKQSMGISPHQYVSQQRVEKAKQFLKKSNSLSIADIVLECGFSSQSHLTKVFKKQLGITPKAYQKQV
ncbi:MAG: AraC family transcriptional regulator [Phormidesmis sp.]